MRLYSLTVKGDWMQKIKTDNFEIEIHDSPDGYYVDVKTKSYMVSVFRTHVHVHTSLRKIEIAKDMEVDATDEP